MESLTLPLLKKVSNGWKMAFQAEIDESNLIEIDVQ
jgi:hypothetical protein